MSVAYHQLTSEIIKKLDDLKESRSFIIGIDGNCGSGKTTLASELSDVLVCDMIHIDDFFLPDKLRNKSRLHEIAGNFHYERFETEVIKNLSCDMFTYQIYSCKEKNYIGEKSIRNTRAIIIEGSYSFSHDFYKKYDYKIFVQCDPKTQINRLRKRVGNENLKNFKLNWIPMENQYFEMYNPAQYADACYKNS